MSALWSAEDAQAATLGRVTLDFAASGISIDTRTLKPGDLYVALKGEHRDGHEFLNDAFAAKASAALVSHVPADLPASAPLLVAANTQRALEDLARAARARSSAQIVAVTGSAGKTTTKEMLKLAFGALAPTHASGASFNNHWGVPLSLATLPREVAFGVFEIGMNHFGEIRQLVSFVRPHVALITTIAPAHLEFFGSCEAIADAKSEIFEGLVAGGIAVLPADSLYTERLVARARQANVTRLLYFGAKAGSDAHLISYEETDEGARVKAEILGRPVDFRLGAPGRHFAANALGALLTIAAMEGDVMNAAAVFGEFSALKGRGARFSVYGIDVIDESYNANPASMAAALALLGSAKGRRIAVLGDMLELGENGAALHAGLKPAIEAAGAERVFLCGPQMKALWDALPAARRGGYAATAAELAPLVKAALEDGDTVLVKGSNGSRTGLIIEMLKGGAG